MKICDMKHTTHNIFIYVRLLHFSPYTCICHEYFNIHVGKDGVCDTVCTLPPQWGWLEDVPLGYYTMLPVRVRKIEKYKTLAVGAYLPRVGV
jgi:hypothetical protein